jgi:hypothetical protein
MAYNVTKKDWEAHCASHAHLAVFSEVQPPEFDRIDFALIIAQEHDPKPLAYVTIRELDKETAYLKRGGAFDETLIHSRQAIYLTGIDWLMERYLRLTTLVENDNVRYLKLAMAAGFRVIGIRNFKGSILLELLKERV